MKSRYQLMAALVLVGVTASIAAVDLVLLLSIKETLTSKEEQGTQLSFIIPSNL